MSVLPIITIPNPLLKQKSLPVENITEEVKELVENMRETMLFHKSCVGIAAVQVAALSRIIIVDVSLAQTPHRSSGLLVMINPVIAYSSGKSSSREGCLSVPDFIGSVTRKKKIEVEYLDINGQKQRLKTEGFEAVCIQHEIDHLDGYVFLDRVTSVKTDVFRR
ncbi:peptide deformylase [Endomicrobium proavitum]|uniref:Peptide deformylase n=1 Tax=Endomicrobium proavitum TaxID=1408281 RepID=A0A0G3WI05_9BACT|nr:peptide deformylase [Endomicrobium proavitum]AKL97492.1 Peptide deformylase [Endomicrobium proavitum]